MDSYSPSKFLNKINKRNRFYHSDDQQSENENREPSNLVSVPAVLANASNSLTVSTVSKRKSTEEKNKINNLANRLKTLLKLPKAHKWVIYEWFYSNLDQPLFCCNRPNDFQLCLNDIFPQLKTRNLRRAEWCQIRKLMGKPRRCSSAFLEEERQTLRRKREKIREIHLNSSIENLADYQDLPDTITMPLIIGSKCTVLFKKTHDGLFNGTINAIDLQNGTYRVSFDKPGFGFENIFDFEVRSVDRPETMPLAAFESKKSRPAVSSGKRPGGQTVKQENDELDRSGHQPAASGQPLNNHLNQQQLLIAQHLNPSISQQHPKDDHQHSGSGSSFENNSAELSNDMNSINSDESFVRFMNHCSINSNHSGSVNSFANTVHPELRPNGDQSNGSRPVQSSGQSNSHLSGQPNSLGQLDEEKMVGNYPLKFLTCIVNFYKLINKKSAKLNELKSMNTQAEHHKSSGKCKLSNEFRNEYATIILELEKIKDQINLTLEHLDKYIKELKIVGKPPKSGQPTEEEFVKRNLTNRRIDPGSELLITKLIGLLLMVKSCASTSSEEDLSSLQQALKAIKQTLQHKNSHCFENQIELHFNHLNYSSRLDAFHNDHL